MVHDQITGYLPDLAAGALDDELATRLRSHLQECRECREWLATHRTLEAVLELPAPDAEHPRSELLARFVVDASGLEVGVRRSVSGHLEICHRCAEEAELCRQAVAAPQADQHPRQPEQPPGATVSQPSAPPGAAARAPAAWSRLGARVMIAAAAVIVVVGAGLYLARAPRIQQQYVLSHTTLRGTTTIEAVKTIEVSLAHLEPGSDVLLRAESVALGDGFTVGDNAKLTIESRTLSDDRTGSTDTRR